MQLPIGYDNFRKIREQNLHFVDKSLFIQEVLDDRLTEVVVIMRPRRFGKTLNLSMLQHFLAAETYGRSTEGLFEGLKIMQAGQPYLDHYRHYPVIFITFKGVKGRSFEEAFDSLCYVMSDVYREHGDLLSSPVLDGIQKAYIKRILAREAPMKEIKVALKELTYFLSKHHKINPWLLIDEYDTPIQKSFVTGFYDPMIDVMRSIFGETLKTNPYLHKAVVTGILRVARESLFSDLNNVRLYSLLNTQYSTHFGFTESDLGSLVEQANIQDKLPEIKYWYNGYQVGNTILYNPWSIVNFFQGYELKPYWVNTSDNQLIRDLVIHSTTEFKTQFELLLRNEPIEQMIDEHTVFQNLKQSPSSVWSLLYMSGYLKVIEQRPYDRGIQCKFLPPNQEVRDLYCQIIQQWLSVDGGVVWYEHFLQDLLSGDVATFEQKLHALMEQVVSHYDMANYPESFYHGLMLGFTASLAKHPDYILSSNRESGEGRYDYLILAKNPSQLTILFEFKRVEQINQLKAAAENALVQIDSHHYIAQAQQHGCKKLLKVGLAFSGKRFVLASQDAGLM